MALTKEPLLEESDTQVSGLRPPARPVPAALAPYVESITTVVGTGAPRVYLPDARTRLLFVRSPRGQGLTGCAVGPRASAWRKGPSRDEGLLVRLAVGAAPALLGVTTAELAGRVTPLEALVGPRARQLEEELSSSRDSRVRLASIEDMLLKSAQQPRRHRIDPRSLHDQAHMVADFRRLAGRTPAELRAELHLTALVADEQRRSDRTSQRGRITSTDLGK